MVKKSGIWGNKDKVIKISDGDLLKNGRYDEWYTRDKLHVLNEITVKEGSYSKQLVRFAAGSQRFVKIILQNKYLSCQTYIAGIDSTG